MSLTARRVPFAAVLFAAIPLGGPAPADEPAEDPAAAAEAEVAAAEPEAAAPADPVRTYDFPGLRLHTDLPPALAEAEGRRAAANVAAFRELMAQQPAPRPVSWSPRSRAVAAPLIAPGEPVEVHGWRLVDAWAEVELPWQARGAQAVPGGAALLPPPRTRVGPLSVGPARAQWFGPAGIGTAARGAVAAWLANDYGVTDSSWLRDGLAEVGRFRTTGGGRVRVSKDVYDYLRHTAAHPLERPRAADIADFAAGAPAINPDFAPFGLEPATTAPFRWAYTHLMLHNPNYSDSFRGAMPGLLRAMGRSEFVTLTSQTPSQPIGVQQVFVGSGGVNGTGQTTTLLRPIAPPSQAAAVALAEAVASRYEARFGRHERRIEFEFGQFLDTFAQGLDPALTAWDWSVALAPLAPGKNGAVRVPVAARRGWQPTGALLTAGQEVAYRTRGEWSVGPDADLPHFDPAADLAAADDPIEPAAEPDPLTAAGGDDGRGALVGAFFDPRGMRLSEEFELGARGTLVVPGDGHLVLRCRDGWGQLSDNAGGVTVTVRRTR